MQHIIKKQFIDLTLDKGLDHFRIQHLVSSQYWADIVPLLDKAFDKIGNDDEVIQVDKLEIDLGTISVKSLEKNEWGSHLQSKIETILSAMVHPVSVSGTAIPVAKRLNVFQQWFFYMRKGYLPWNTIRTDAQWYQLVLEALAVDFNSVQLLRNAIQKDHNVLERTVSQHTVLFLKQLTAIFTAEKQDRLTCVIDELVTLALYLKADAPVAALSEKKIRYIVWAKALSIAATVNFTTANRKLEEELVGLFLQENKVVKKIPAGLRSKLPLTIEPIEKNILLQKTISVAENKKGSKEFKHAAQKKEEEITSFAGKQEANPNNKKPTSVTDEKISANELAGSATEFIERQFDRTISSSIDDGGIVVANAGVVLLHPFLHFLFSRLQLTQEGKFIDKSLHQQALYIVHYLATGSTDAEEHELVIGKILSDYPLEEAVEKGVPISKEISAEADDMILAAIQQWDKLTGTSIAGLREGFLQRSGKLSVKNGNLYLQVEQSAIDILLDYLPWNLGMIKLPWMKEILRVEWR